MAGPIRVKVGVRVKAMLAGTPCAALADLENGFA